MSPLQREAHPHRYRQPTRRHPTPAPVLTLGATDCRFWRARGVPAYVYGCSPVGMGVPNEAVKVEEYLAVLQVHALSAFDYLSRPDLATT